VQGVGAELKSEAVRTKVHKRVVLRERGCRRSEDSGGVNQCTPDSIDLSLLKQECT
jgi:hypothetical protein